MNHDEIISMAREAGMSPYNCTLVCIADGAPEPEARALERFAALVAERERERIFGAGMQFDGQMRLQLTRWEDGQCFAAAAHFSAEQTHCGPDDLLTNAVERLEDSLDACIAAAIRARDRNPATGVVTGGEV